MKKIYITVIKFLGKLVPVKNKIVFESSPEMSDSARVLFDGIIDAGLNDKYKLIWYVQDPTAPRLDKYKQIKNVEFKSIKTDNIVQKLFLNIKRDFTMASCKYYLFSNVNYSKVPPKANQMFYYTTHGIGLKQVKDRLYPSTLFSRVATMSDLTKDWLSAVYNEVDVKGVNNGHPRLDLLNQDNELVSNIDAQYRKDFGIDKSSKIIIWVPTYRTHQSGDTNDLETGENETDIPLLKVQKDWNLVNEALKDTNSVLVLKPHPAQDLNKVHIEDLSNIRLLSNDYLIENDIHLYSFLNITDGMITDYSSVGYDFLLNDKPLAFSVDDLEIWSKNVGFIDTDIDALMPGDILKTPEDLVYYIKNLENDEFNSERNILKDKFHDYNEVSSTERTIKYLEM